MKVTYELNIGLHINGGDNSDDAVIRRAREAVVVIRGLITGECSPAALPLETRVEQSNTELTLVVRFATEILHAHVVGGVYMIAEHFEQDCVALFNTLFNSGSLIGPNAKSWGDFNPELFIRF